MGQRALAASSSMFSGSRVFHRSSGPDTVEATIYDEFGDVDEEVGGWVASDGDRETESLLRKDTAARKRCHPPVKGSTEGRKTLNFASLVMLTFFTVSGGPIGVEGVFRPLGALKGFASLLIFPFIYSVPIALIAAEMATLFPDDGGYTVWVNKAFGPFWAFQEGYWSWISGVLDNAMYPVLFVDILFPRNNGASPSIWLARVVVAVAFSTLNMLGLKIGGRALIILGMCVMAPYAIFCVAAFPHVDPQNWFAPIAANASADSTDYSASSSGSKMQAQDTGSGSSVGKAEPPKEHGKAFELDADGDAIFWQHASGIQWQVHSKMAMPQWAGDGGKVQIKHGGARARL